MSEPAIVLNFLLYFGVAIVLLAAFLAAYTLLTPVREWQEIRAGNSAVSIALGGAMIGFALPLASAIAHNQSLTDTTIAAGVALLVQLACFAAVRLLRRDATAALARGEVAEGVFLAAASLALGVLNAACLS